MKLVNVNLYQVSIDSGPLGHGHLICPLVDLIRYSAGLDGSPKFKDLFW